MRAAVVLVGLVTVVVGALLDRRGLGSWALGRDLDALTAGAAVLLAVGAVLSLAAARPVRSAGGVLAGVTSVPAGIATVEAVASGYPPAPSPRSSGSASGWGDTIGAMLHLHTFGDGRPVLALHGVTAHGARWRVLAERLPELRIHGVDLRGHGRSPWAPPWGLEQHAADAVATLDALGLDRVPVIGHSFGGAIALHLARLAPERVERLVLLDPAIGLDAHDMLETAESTRADESYPDLAAARAERAERWAGVADDLVDEELAAHLVADGDRWRYRYCRSAVVAAWGEMARPAIVPAHPTLLMPAAKADFVRPAWVQECGDALGDALTVTDVDAGHLVFLERTAEVADAIRAFLR